MPPDIPPSSTLPPEKKRGRRPSAKKTPTKAAKANNAAKATKASKGGVGGVIDTLRGFIASPAKADDPKSQATESDTADPDDPASPELDESLDPVPESADEAKEFEVESIVDSRMNRRLGKFQYRVRWAGYTAAEESWEPIANLGNAMDLVAEYHKKQPNKPKPKDPGQASATS